MNTIDLTEQFVRDYAEIEQARAQAAREADRLRVLNERLAERLAASESTVAEREATLRDLQEQAREGERARAEELERLGAELGEKSRAFERLMGRSKGLAAKFEDLRSRQDQELERKESTIQKLTEELGARRREIDALKSRVRPAPTAGPREDPASEARRAGQIKAIRAEVLDELWPRLRELAHLPLRSRLAAFVLDVGLAAAIARWAYQSGGGGAAGGPPSFAVIVLGGFALRSLISPGRIVIGFSPRRIGHESVPTGAAGPFRRIFCGLMHYGPIVGAAYVVASDRSTLEILANLPDQLARAGDLRGLQEVASGALRGIGPGRTGLAMALAAAWSACVSLSLLLSRWIFRETPYFWGATFVETIWRVGFERSRLPEWIFDADES